MTQVYGFTDKRVAVKLREFANNKLVETVPPRLNKNVSAMSLIPFVLAEDAVKDGLQVKVFVGEWYENLIIKSASVSDPVDLYNTHGCLATTASRLSRAGRTGLMTWGGDGFQVAALYGCDSDCSGAPSVTDPTVPNGKVGDPYSLAIAVTGTASSSNVFGLPTGLSYTGTGTGGNITGTPTEAGTFWFQIRATGSCVTTKLKQIVIDPED